MAESPLISGPRDGKGTVTIAWLHPDEVSHSWHRSLLDLIMFDALNVGRVVGEKGGGWATVNAETGGIVDARNKVAEGFVKSDVQWLLWVDADMGFERESLERLMAVADPVERPIVGGLCFASRNVSDDGMNGWIRRPVPTLYSWAEDGDKKGWKPLWDYPPNTLVKVGATGSAFVLVHRSVYEALGPNPYNRIANPWEEGGWFGEDLSFCMRAGAKGIPIHVHTGVRTSHMKSQWVAEGDYWASRTMPPAAERIDVIVPVLRRPQNVAPLVMSLRASTGLADLVFVGDPGDDVEREAVEATGARWIECSGSTFAQKANLGYRSTSNPFLIVVGDDVRFHPGWWDHAYAGHRHHDVAVVGTNDLANPAVIRGEHATAPTFARRYVDEVGGGWDAPGVLAHEGYRHWFVDNEWCVTAKQRGQWVMALGSIVEHLHPIAGRAPMDEVYELGQSFAKVDEETFRRRLKRSMKREAAA